MCQTVGHAETGRMGAAYGCGCMIPQRRHFSSAEKLDMLRNYAEELGKELEGVQERIQELEKK
jgi:hypothetical protein